MTGLFRAELMKIRRSLIPLAVIVIPLMVFGVMWLALSNIPESPTWLIVSEGVAGFWVYFLMPLTVTVLTALMGQIEHRHNTWSYALSQPQAKWLVFVVKAIIVMGMMLLLSLLIIGAFYGAGTLGTAMNDEGGLLGTFSFEQIWRKMFRAWQYSALLVAMQFWVAMRFGGMAIPLLFGIGGMIFAAIAAIDNFIPFEFLDADYLPWLLPGAGLSVVPDERQIGLLYGGIGGVAAFLVASVSLARKDWN